MFGCVDVCVVCMYGCVDGCRGLFGVVEYRNELPLIEYRNELPLNPKPLPQLLLPHNRVYCGVRRVFWALLWGDENRVRRVAVGRNRVRRVAVGHNRVRRVAVGPSCLPHNRVRRVAVLCCAILGLFECLWGKTSCGMDELLTPQ